MKINSALIWIFQILDNNKSHASLFRSRWHLKMLQRWNSLKILKTLNLLANKDKNWNFKETVIEISNEILFSFIYHEGTVLVYNWKLLIQVRCIKFSFVIRNWVNFSKYDWIINKEPSVISLSNIFSRNFLQEQFALVDFSLPLPPENPFLVLWECFVCQQVELDLLSVNMYRPIILGFSKL